MEIYIIFYGIYWEKNVKRMIVLIKVCGFIIKNFTLLETLIKIY
jgi:hypothetical protein